MIPLLRALIFAALAVIVSACGGTTEEQPLIQTQSCSDTNTCDGDRDGVFDQNDSCRSSSPNATVGSDGCELAPEPEDADNDGVNDDDDSCKGTVSGATVDTFGCEIEFGFLTKVSGCDTNAEAGASQTGEIIEAETYVSFWDTDSGNQGGEFRDDDVDIVAIDGNECGQFVITSTERDEWLEYDVRLSNATYEVNARVSSANRAGLLVEVAGNEVGSIRFDTGDIDEYETLKIGDVEIDSRDTYTVRVQAQTDDFNLNWLEFVELDDDIMDSDGDGVADEDDDCDDTKSGADVDESGCDINIAILVFSKTETFRHVEGIDAGIEMFRQMEDDTNWEFDFTENGNRFTEENLEKYRVIVWLNTTGDVLNDAQQEAFQNYMESGGGYVGIHAAADTEYREDWGSNWYRDFVGAQFDSHPNNPRIQEATVRIEVRDHPATEHLGRTWIRSDEWYNYRRNPRDQEGITVLMTVDESTYVQGNMGDDHPIVWQQEVGDGRMFYTGHGDTGATYREPDYIQHVKGGIIWAGQISE